MDRAALLSLAFELPCAPYACGSLTLRPYSMAAHRRAGSLSLISAAAGIEAARDALGPMLFYRELDALYWLLTAPLEVVRRTFLEGGAPAVWKAILKQTVPPGEVARFTEEMARIFAMCRAALFDVDDREPAGGAPASTDSIPPEDVIAPGMDAVLVVALSERLKMDEETLLEWLPFPRVQQYAHAIQYTNPTVWTVAPRAMAPDPHAGEAAPDPGFGEAISF